MAKTAVVIVHIAQPREGSMEDENRRGIQRPEDIGLERWELPKGQKGRLRPAQVVERDQQNALYEAVAEPLEQLHMGKLTERELRREINNLTAALQATIINTSKEITKRNQQLAAWRVLKSAQQIFTGVADSDHRVGNIAEEEPGILIFEVAGLRLTIDAVVAGIVVDSAPTTILKISDHMVNYDYYGKLRFEDQALLRLLAEAVTPGGRERLRELLSDDEFRALYKQPSPPQEISEYGFFPPPIGRGELNLGNVGSLHALSRHKVPSELLKGLPED